MTCATKIFIEAIKVLILFMLRRYNRFQVRRGTSTNPQQPILLPTDVAQNIEDNGSGGTPSTGTGTTGTPPPAGGGTGN